MTECLPNFPRHIRHHRPSDSWEGADHPDGPWRPISAPQSGLPWEPSRRGSNPPAPGNKPPPPASPPVADHPDARRLAYLMKEVEGFCHISKDRFNYASELAQRDNREVPSAMDELNGFRQMIDDAMAAEGEL